SARSAGTPREETGAGDRRCPPPAPGERVAAGPRHSRPDSNGPGTDGENRDPLLLNGRLRAPHRDPAGRGPVARSGISRCPTTGRPRLSPVPPPYDDPPRNVERTTPDDLHCRAAWRERPQQALL